MPPVHQIVGRYSPGSRFNWARDYWYCSLTLSFSSGHLRRSILMPQLSWDIECLNAYSSIRRTLLAYFIEKFPLIFVSRRQKKLRYAYNWVKIPKIKNNRNIRIDPLIFQGGSGALICNSFELSKFTISLLFCDYIPFYTPSSIHYIWAPLSI